MDTKFRTTFRTPQGAAAPRRTGSVTGQKGLAAAGRWVRLLIAPIAVLAACAGCKSSAETPAAAAPPPPEVAVAPVVQKDVPIHKEWVGTMVGNVNADIRPKVGGFLLERLYKEGSFVQKGQPLFQLDKRQAVAAVEEAQGNLARARADLSQAQIDVNRYTPLVAQQAVSQAELDKAHSNQQASAAQVQAAQAALDNAKLNLAWTKVTSPIAGIAGISNVAIGDLMSPSSLMTTVSSLDPIYVDFSIAEQDYLRYRRQRSGRAAGNDLEMFLADGTVYGARGHLLFVNREVDTRTGTIQVRAEFSNPGNILRPGQYARIRAVVESLKGALVVPQASVSELQGIYRIAVVSQERKVDFKQVKLGPQVGDKWVIESGLQPGESVVVDGLQRIKSGMTVAPTPFKDTQADASGGK